VSEATVHPVSNAMRNSLVHRSLDNAYVQAFRVVVSDPTTAFTGGPVLEAPQDAALRHCRYGLPFDHVDLAAPRHSGRVLRGTWNYVGPVYPHFGHVQAEMVHRIIPSRVLFDCDQWLAVTGKDAPINRFTDLPTAYRDAIAFLGIHADNLKIISEDTHVERLNIVAQGSQFGLGPNEAYLEALRDYSTQRLDDMFPQVERPVRVYVTRTGVPEGGNFLGEAWLEEWLQVEGFYIFRPEDYPLSVQMDVYRKAEILVFSEGSACHGVELLGRRMLQQVYMLGRREDHRGIFRNVLHGRSVSYHSEIFSQPLGYCVLNPQTLEPLGHMAQNLFDVKALGTWLHRNRITRNSVPHIDRYLDYARADLERHISINSARGERMASTAVLDGMREDLAVRLELLRQSHLG